MTFSVIIPARYASSRLPGKPLLDLAGKSMVQRVYEQAQKSQANTVVVATDDSRIEMAVKAFGGEVVMTSPEHASGTDRLQEVVTKLGLGNEEIVVNVQGDEPLMPPELIDQVAVNLAQNARADISTLCELIESADQLFDPNAVKVAFDCDGMAMYFSRAPIPWNRDAFASGVDKVLAKDLTKNYHRHVGIYAYRVRFLHQFVEWDQAPIEILESLEQLRALHHGVGIHVELACTDSGSGVDTPEDLKRLRELLT
ncbi:MAG: 3-deoxy-manno-octulosonate cytidylyltransferase [Pseudomonadales bacterium]|nr:3-deoxy-manno-octulosonate cytidylyltransferase [Pseudomonadales bacterium]